MGWNESDWCALAGEWISLVPSREATSENRARVVRSIEGHLRALGFEVRVQGEPGRAPTILALRGACRPGETVAIYNHYDVELPLAGWTSDPSRLVERGGRYYGVGIADNLGSLALRLLASRAVRDWPPVAWLIEGEEELGSPSLDALEAELRSMRPAFWIDETGFFVSERRQTLLALDHPTRPTGRDVARMMEIAGQRGVETCIERRRMNRFSPDGMSRVDRLMSGAGYLAIGPNDGLANIHGADESLPRFSLDLSATQWTELFNGWTGRHA